MINAGAHDSQKDIKSAIVHFIGEELSELHYQYEVYIYPAADNLLVETTSGDSRANMQYSDMFVSSIIRRQKVNLIGWPEDIPFVQCSKFRKSEHLRTIRRLLLDKTIHFRKLSSDEEVDNAAKYWDSRLSREKGGKSGEVSQSGDAGEAEMSGVAGNDACGRSSTTGARRLEPDGGQGNGSSVSTVEKRRRDAGELDTDGEPGAKRPCHVSPTTSVSSLSSLFSPLSP